MTAGDQLGPYQIESLLGAGGMGEVFRARDTRLDRTVAIKVLPAGKAEDDERRRRFMLEARAASALNHPNIVTVHDIANEAGADYIVMEYVEGESLDKRIAAKRVPISEAACIAAQAAGALAAAHAAGVIHRDIKPANLILTPAAQVKVLDFGLAKLTEVRGDNETVTQESALTATGVVMGTIAYMSPEQAAAKPLDSRTDVFSLGIVLYEMLSGRRPFRGMSQVETMHAIIHDSPPPLPKIPRELDEILAKSLAKNPNDRYQHCGDFALDLRRFLNARESHQLAGQAPASARSGPAWAVAATVALLGLPAAWWIGRSSPGGTEENPLAHAKFTRITDFPGIARDGAISSDGKFVAFLSDHNGPFDIFVRQIGTAGYVNLTQGRAPNLDALLKVLGFNAAGTEVWFHDNVDTNPLMSMPLMGGAPRVFLARSPAQKPPLNLAWSPDASRIIYHTADPGDPLYVADPTGGNAVRVHIAKSADYHNHFPTWSADGKWIYFAHGIPTTNELDIWRVASSGGQPERMTHHNSEVSYPAAIDDRTLIYVAKESDGSGPWLWSLDTARKVTQRVSFGLEKYTSVAASADGRKLVATVSNPSANLWSVPILNRIADDEDVKLLPIPNVRALAPRYAGTSLFFLSSRGSGDGLWRYRQGEALEIWRGSDGALFSPPAISPDHGRVAFSLRKSGRLRLHTISADGAELQPLAETLDVRGSAAWSPDGKWIVTGADDAGGTGLFRVSLDGGPPVRLASGAATNPVWSPAGDLIVYTGGNVGGTAPLLAVRQDGEPVALPKIEVWRNGVRARFSPDASALIYMQNVGSLQDFWRLDLATKTTRALTRLKRPGMMYSFDITPDGKQIVFDRLRENSNIVLIDLPPANR